MKPQRPSALKAQTQAAAKLAQGEPDRLVLKLPPATKRGLKARAAHLGITVSAYFVRLARADGVDVPEMSGGTSDD